MTLQVLITILLLAMVIEFCVNRIKEIAGEKVMKVIKAPYWALILGVLLASLFEVNIFIMIMEHPSKIPIIDQCITGLIISAGSTATHELIEKLRSARTTQLE